MDEVNFIKQVKVFSGFQKIEEKLKKKKISCTEEQKKEVKERMKRYW